MAIEIERRFLVDDPRRAIAAHTIVDQVDIRQGYFGHVNGLKLRVRIMSDAGGRSSAVLTRKSPRRGICREEYEQAIGVDPAERALSTLPPSHIIRKRRYRIMNDDSVIWSVDWFEGQNAGLVIAEIDLPHPGQSFKLPAWVGSEITLDPRYGNSALARTPILKGLLSPPIILQNASFVPGGCARKLLISNEATSHGIGVSTRASLLIESFR